MTDAFGHRWNLATFKREVSGAEMEKGMKEQFGVGGPDNKAAKKKAKK